MSTLTCKSLESIWKSDVSCSGSVEKLSKLGDATYSFNFSLTINRIDWRAFLLVKHGKSTHDRTLDWRAIVRKEVSIGFYNSACRHWAYLEYRRLLAHYFTIQILALSFRSGHHIWQLFIYFSRLTCRSTAQSRSFIHADDTRLFEPLRDSLICIISGAIAVSMENRHVYSPSLYRRMYAVNGKTPKFDPVGSNIVY